MDAALKIEIKTLIEEMIKQSMQNAIKEDIQRELRSNYESLREQGSQLMEKKMNELSLDILNDAMDRLIGKYTTDTKQQIDAIQTRVTDIFKSQLPANFINKFNDLFTKFQESDAKVKQFRHDVEALLNNNFIEIVSNEQIKQLYEMANCQMSDIQNALNIQQSHSYRLVNGEVLDFELRHRLKRFLLKKIKEKEAVNG